MSTLSSVFFLSSEEGIWQDAKRLEQHYCWSTVSLRKNKCKHICIFIHRDCREGGTWDGRSNNIILCCLVYFSLHLINYNNNFLQSHQVKCTLHRFHQKWIRLKNQIQICIPPCLTRSDFFYDNLFVLGYIEEIVKWTKLLWDNYIKFEKTKLVDISYYLITHAGMQR